MVGEMRNDDKEMMYVAKLLLELPQLIFAEEWRSSGPLWNSTKKRSVHLRRPRRVVGFKCFRTGRWSSSLMAHFGGCGVSCNSISCKPSNREKLAGKKRTAYNVNPDTTVTRRTTLLPMMSSGLKVTFKLSNGYSDEKHCGSGSGSVLSKKESLSVDGGVVGMKRKKNPSSSSPDVEILDPIPKKRCFKVTFKKPDLGEKDSSSGVSDEFSLAACCQVSTDSSDQTDTKPSSSLVVVESPNSAADPQSSSEIKKDKGDGDVWLIPDLNIPLTEEPDPTPAVQLPTAAVAAPRQSPQAQSFDDQPVPTIPFVLLSNNDNKKNSCSNVLAGLAPDTTLTLQINTINHGCNVSTDSSAAAKEKRTIRMRILKQRKRGYMAACC